MARISEPSSFRDPKGYVFYDSGKVFRYITPQGVTDFTKLLDSGTIELLVSKNMLVPFSVVENKDTDDPGMTIQPQKIPFISYPYEWCFSQYKDAALLVLAMMKLALTKNFWLKDASSYNVQFYQGKPIWIDTLSLEPYQEGAPWVAYRQFCQHFLAPLLLMAKVDLSLGKLMREFIDGVPLELASRLLPSYTKLTPFTVIHIHLHARLQRKYGDKGNVASKTRKSLPKKGLSNLLDSLSLLIKSLKLREKKSEWGDYYNFTNYSNEAFEKKSQIVSEYIEQASPSVVWDLGANMGEFSRLQALNDVEVLSFDSDYLAVEKNYRYNRQHKIKHILPLVLDLSNPSPAIGWNNQERKNIIERSHADVILALALLHHLVIGNNVPMGKVAEFFVSLAPELVIEFVPKDDSQVQRLLASREDIFSDYDQQHFERIFSQYYQINGQEKIPGSLRTVYWMSKK